MITNTASAKLVPRLGFVVEWSGNESMRKRVLSCYESYDQVDIFGYGQGQEE